MATTKSAPSNEKFINFLHNFGWDLMFGSIATFYVLMVPYTKVEESFNVQAMHDILYHRHHIEKYDHLDFPGVVPRTFLGALFVSTLASPVVILGQLLCMPKIYSLIIVRLVLGCMVLSSLRFLRIQIRRKFGLHVETFFVIITALQFHLLFYCTRPLPNILAFTLVTLAYSFWFKGNSSATLKCLTFATIIFRCDTVLLLGPIGVELLLRKSISVWEAVKCCIITALLSVGLTVLLDTIMWQKIIWPELEVFWFNSILNRSSKWGTHSFHWYFTSALPRSLLVAFPLSLLGMLLDRRILRYIIPVFTFVLLYSKLPHKELRFIIGAVPIFNVSAAITASRIYNNRKKNMWRLLYIAMIGSFLVRMFYHNIYGILQQLSWSLCLESFTSSRSPWLACPAVDSSCAIGCCISRSPLLQYGHSSGASENMRGKLVHIDPYAAMNGISRFLETDQFRYSKEEGISLDNYWERNFTFLLNEHSNIDGFKCLFAVNGFARARLQNSFLPIILSMEPKVFVHGSMRDQDVALSSLARLSIISHGGFMRRNTSVCNSG